MKKHEQKQPFEDVRYLLFDMVIFQLAMLVFDKYTLTPRVFFCCSTFPGACTSISSIQVRWLRTNTIHSLLRVHWGQQAGSSGINLQAALRWDSGAWAGKGENMFTIWAIRCLTIFDIYRWSCFIAIAILIYIYHIHYVLRDSCLPMSCTVFWIY